MRTAYQRGIFGKLLDIDWLLPVLAAMIGLVGVAMIYSASGGDWDLGAQAHLTRLCAGLILMLAIAVVNIRFWLSAAYPAYIGALVLLLGVEFFGVSVNGSQRWLEIGPVRFQPSEMMKIAMIMALARFYHDLPAFRVSRPEGLLGAILIIGMPMALILRQPDLGTSLLLGVSGVIIVFLAGINWKVIIGGVLTAGISAPIFIRYGLHEYQRARILTFFGATGDPTGADYQITQSKIALGSGGVTGKGFQNGTQASLKYVPENRTDFIFTVIGEEFGLVGGLLTMGIFIALFAVCFRLAMACKQVFSRLLILGLTVSIAMYVYINLAMVMGLAPVVGVPLILISYGGTVMLAVLASCGIILSAHLYRDQELPKGSGVLL